jgi:oxygen-independent coproporphyrinogen-3 oxidase
MEVPYNTELYRNMKDGGTELAPVPDWDTKRRWVGQAFEAFEGAGYRVGSAYTAVRPVDQSFLYRDALWHGADLVGIGVSSFSHVAGVHYQNEHSFEPYLQRVEAGTLPILRALSPTEEERMIREFVLQMKLGRVETRPFAEKFGVDLVQRFRQPLERHREAGWLDFDAREVRATRAGLLRIDSLLPDFFLERHQGVRYA